MNPDKIRLLKDRAKMLAAARAFFAERSVCEVDCSIMTPTASVDVHIDLVRAYCMSSKTHYLHSSPEYEMKKLLANGIGDIYQLSHVFRDNEYSMRHHPEFTMAEWYRIDFTFQQMINETLEFVKLFVGDKPVTIMSYREVFQKYTGIDYLTANEDDLISHLRNRGIDPHHNIDEEGKDALLNIILGTLIEPNLGKDELFVIKFFPASQAALAQTRMNGEEDISERFEVFYNGLELANGYHELTNSREQLDRLLHSNTIRERLGKDTLPIDDTFIRALEMGLPDCCGVAVGFDRLMMLRHGIEDIADVLPLTEKMV